MRPDHAQLEAKAANILARLRSEGRTPLMRFCYRAWHREDYEALDRLLSTRQPLTSRYVLEADEGIMVGSEGWPVARLVCR